MDFVLAFAEEHVQEHVPSTHEFDPYIHVFLDAGHGNVLAFFELPTKPDMGQLVAQHTVNGCNLQPGDLPGSGTRSGPNAGQGGSLLELMMGGAQPLRRANGDTRAFLQDGDDLKREARLLVPESTLPPEIFVPGAPVCARAHMTLSLSSCARRCEASSCVVASGRRLYGHRSKSGRNMGLQFEEGVRETPALKRKGVRHVRRVQQLVVETARRRIDA